MPKRFYSMRILGRIRARPPLRPPLRATAKPPGQCRRPCLPAERTGAALPKLGSLPHVARRPPCLDCWCGHDQLLFMPSGGHRARPLGAEALRLRRKRAGAQGRSCISAAPGQAFHGKRQLALRDVGRPRCGCRVRTAGAAGAGEAVRRMMGRAGLRPQGSAVPGWRRPCRPDGGGMRRLRSGGLLGGRRRRRPCWRRARRGRERA